MAIVRFLFHKDHIQRATTYL
uniref:Uncharacterized protein n=1 Tax=Anguilla anguilla TaxID=7936 RepID=A0A0E9UVM6_ANGAN